MLTAARVATASPPHKTIKRTALARLRSLFKLQATYGVRSTESDTGACDVWLDYKNSTKGDAEVNASRSSTN